MKRRNGFTLVELLVVIGIIAVLISLLLPALNKARAAAKVVARASNQHQIYLAVAMYAHDNKGFLPPCNAWQRSRGAEYLQSYGAYPWEFSAASSFWYDPADQLPPGVVWASTVRWYGIGLLVSLKYLPPTQVVACPDFETQNGVNFSARGGFSLTNAYYQYNGDPASIWATTGANQGSYVLNTLPYYALDNSNLAHGKIGKKGRNGGFWSVPGGVYNVEHITALMSCLTSYADFDPNPATITHGRRGANVTYLDGHVVWMPIDQKTWNTMNLIGWPQSSANDLSCYWNGFFAWASIGQ